MQIIRHKQHAVLGVTPQQGARNILKTKEKAGASVFSYTPRNHPVRINEGFMLQGSSIPGDPLNWNHQTMTASFWVDNECEDAAAIWRYFTFALNGSTATESYAGNNGSNQANQRLRAQTEDGSGNQVTRANTANGVAAFSGLTHVYLRMHEPTATYQIWVDGVNVTTTPTVNPGPNVETGQIRLFNEIGRWFYFGLIKNLWLDDSNGDANHILLFRDFGTGLPKELGDRGEIPFGTIPRIYLGGDLTAYSGGALGGYKDFIQQPADTGYFNGCNNGSLLLTVSTGSVFDVTNGPDYQTPLMLGDSWMDRDFWINTQRYVPYDNMVVKKYSDGFTTDYTTREAEQLSGPHGVGNDRGLDQRIASILATETGYDSVIMLIGGNDFNNSKDLATVTNAFTTVANALDADAGINNVLLLPPQPGTEGWTAQQVADRDAYRSWLQTEAGFRGYDYFDYWPFITDPVETNRIRADLRDDEFHLNAKGWTVLRDAVDQYLWATHGYG